MSVCPSTYKYVCLCVSIVTQMYLGHFFTHVVQDALVTAMFGQNKISFNQKWLCIIEDLYEKNN